MRNISVILDEPDYFDGEFVDYIDAFNPGSFLSLDRIRMAGTEIVPPLLRALEEQGLQAVIGHDLATVAKLHRASGGNVAAAGADDEGELRLVIRPLRSFGQHDGFAGADDHV